VLTLPIREVLAATPRARIVRLDLSGHPFPFQAGQAVLIGPAGGSRRKPYSIASSPEDADHESVLELLIGLDDDGRPGADLALEPGARVDVEGPLGRFTFPEKPHERRFLFVAGGTGIAPLRAMLRHALDEVDHESIGVLYSARTAVEFAYEEELRHLARQQAIEFAQTVTRDVGPQDWSGTRGRIGRAELAALVHDAATLCFVCGPPSLVADMPGHLLDLGVPRERIRIEEWK
jgi:ferredoxin-NADP reductase